MSIEAVREYLKGYGLEGKVKEFQVSSATVELAAKALNVEGARIAKTISLEQSGGVVLIVAAGDAKIDNHKYKEKFHEKAKMLGFDSVESLTGHPVGGVCPFAVKENVKVYLDDSLKRFEIVFPAAGTPSSAVELTLEELFTASRAVEWVDVCKLPTENV